MGRALSRHYSGGLDYLRANGRTRVTLLPGWAACASGLAARRIRTDRSRYTTVIADVTCKTCLRLMAFAGKLPAATATATTVGSGSGVKTESSPSLENDHARK